MPESGFLGNEKYRILNPIGKGGMGHVYLAEVTDTGNQVVIKEMRICDQEGQRSASIRQTFLTEARILKKLDHPDIPRFIDMVSNHESIFLVMEYIPGSSLQQILTEYGAQPLGSVIDWMLQLCGILSYLHSRTPPVIYRDLKPANLIRRQDGRVSLIDFGAAREYRPEEREDTMFLGTKGYAAPEQYGGRGQTDPRTDLYGLGTTIYHLITGCDPAKTSWREYLIAQGNPNLPNALQQLIQKCTKPNPEERYSSCEEVAAVLKPLSGHWVRETSEQGYTELLSPLAAKHMGEYIIETEVTILHTSNVIPT